MPVHKSSVNPVSAFVTMSTAENLIRLCDLGGITEHRVLRIENTLEIT